MAKPRLGSKALHLLEKLNTLDELVGAGQISGKVMTPRHLAWNYYSLWAITEAGREALCARFASYRVVGM